MTVASITLWQFGEAITYYFQIDWNGTILTVAQIGTFDEILWPYWSPHTVCNQEAGHLLFVAACIAQNIKKIIPLESLRSGSLNYLFFREKKALNSALQTSKCSYLGNTALLTCSHNATSICPASQMQNYRSSNQFFCTFRI